MARKRQSKTPGQKGHRLMEPRGLQAGFQKRLSEQNNAWKLGQECTEADHVIEPGRFRPHIFEIPAVHRRLEQAVAANYAREIQVAAIPEEKVKKQKASSGEKQHAIEKAPAKALQLSSMNSIRKRPKRQRQLDDRAAGNSKINGVLLLACEQQTESGQTARELPLGNWNFGAGFTPCPGCTLVWGIAELE